MKKFFSFSRQRYIDAALASRLDQPPNCTVVVRHNPMAGRPSDFDLVRCHQVDLQRGGGLTLHPLIKAVTPQQRLTRSLMYVDEEEDEDGALEEDGALDEAQEGASWLYGRRRLSADAKQKLGKEGI